MRKYYISLLILILIATTLFLGIGCKKETTETTNAETTVASTASETTETVTTVAETTAEKKPSGKITVWSWHDLDKEVAELFMKENPNIEVEVVKIGPWDIETKLLTAIASGRGAPDVAAVVSRRFQRFASGTGMTDLTEYVGDDASNYLEAPLKEHMYDGKIFALPVTVAVMACLYRRDLFEKYGLEIPETMADLYKIKEKLPKDMYVMPLFVPSGQWGSDAFRVYMQLAGGTIFDENGKVIQNNAAGKQTMNYYKQLIDDKVVMTGAWFTPESYAAIGEGKVVLWLTNISEPSNLMAKFPELSGKWGMAPLPLWEEGSPAITAEYGVKGFCVPAQSKNIPAAEEFVKWICSSKTAQDKFAQNFWFSAYKPYLDSSEILKQPNEYLGGTIPLDVFNAREIKYYNFIDWVQTSDILGQEIDAMFGGEKTPDQAWNDFESRLIGEKLGL